VVSNQPGAAKRKASLDDLRAVHERVVELLAGHGVQLDGYRYCFHHPDGEDPDLSGPCACRKPQPGLITEAAGELGLDLRASWMVGDADRDVEAGRSAGCRTVIVLNSASQHRRNDRVEVDASAGDLAEAAAIITRSAG
jgi:D-glycero-D-manno-heptose 1,7-bisphosphate phosphatase